MAVYRITRFAAHDMDKVVEVGEGLREMLAEAGADFIDIVSYGNGKGVVIAKYPDQATMDAASEIATKAFGILIEAGAVDGDAIHPHTGELISSF